jgi:hypothetical protein
MAADSPLEAAKAKYNTLLAKAEKDAMEGSVRVAKLNLSMTARAAVDPSAPGSVSAMVDRGDGVFVPGARTFQSTGDKERAIAEATLTVVGAEERLARWKRGELRPTVKVPILAALSTGAVGRLPDGSVLSRVDELHVVVVPLGTRSGKPFVVKSPKAYDVRESYRFPGVWWVSGSRTVGKQVMLVLEILDVD